MASKTVIFADRVSNVSVTGSLVRIELATLASLPKASGESAKFAATHELVMPLEGFVNSLKIQDAVIKKLIADGVLKVDLPTQQKASVN